MGSVCIATRRVSSYKSDGTLLLARGTESWFPAPKTERFPKQWQMTDVEVGGTQGPFAHNYTPEFFPWLIYGAAEDPCFPARSPGEVQPHSRVHPSMSASLQYVAF